MIQDFLINTILLERDMWTLKVPASSAHVTQFVHPTYKQLNNVFVLHKHKQYLESIENIAIA